MKKVSDDSGSNFYVTSGELFGVRLGRIDRASQHRHINLYKKFVDQFGGPDSFPSPLEAVNKYFSFIERKRYGRK